MFHPPCLSVPRVCFLSIDPAPTEIYTLSLHDALPISTLPGTSFPAAQSTGLGNPASPPRGVTGLGAAQDQADFTSQCGPGGPMRGGATQPLNNDNSFAAQAQRSRPKAAAASPLVFITSPSAGQTFAPGNTLTVNVQVDPATNATDVVV